MSIKSVMLMAGFTISSLGYVSTSAAEEQAQSAEVKGCIVSRQTGEQYCLPAGERSGYSLPSYIKGHEVDLVVPNGLAITLSDWDNLSYNRLATFTRDTRNEKLDNVIARNGSRLNFSNPRSMRVTAVQAQPEACIVSRSTNAKYCLQNGQRSGYSLPAWIYNHQVDVVAPQGLGVMLSDYDNLSYNHLAVFTGNVPAEDRTHVLAYNGQYLDFSRPHSMRVVASGKPAAQACIKSRETGEQYCLSAGQRSGYSLPAHIYGHEVDVIAPNGLGVMLSDWDNLSYNRLAVFTGNTGNAQLENVHARNGQYLDFSAPRSMRVVEVEKAPEACIISRQTSERYCLPAGQRSGYSLPRWIYNHQVDVEAPQGLGVMLSDFDNLSYNHLAVFTGNVPAEDRTHVLAYNGQYLDFSHPHSMRVIAVDAQGVSVDSISGELDGNDLVFDVALTGSTVANRSINLEFAENTGKVKIDYSSLVYASFDNGATWPVVVDINSTNSLSVPKSTDHVKLRVLTLVDGVNDSGKNVELHAWLDADKADLATHIADIGSDHSANTVIISEMTTADEQITEGASTRSTIQLSETTYRNTPMHIQFINNTAKKGFDINVTVKMIYSDGSVDYRYDLDLLDFKVLNLSAGVSEVVVSYQAIDDTLVEGNEKFYFAAWIVGKGVDYKKDQIIIIDND